MAEVKKVLVLGSSGMLGSEVFNYLKLNDKFEVKGTLRSQIDSIIKCDHFAFNVADNIHQQLETIDKAFSPDYIINCIGIINKYCPSNNPEGIKKAINVGIVRLSALIRPMEIYTINKKASSKNTNAVIIKGPGIASKVMLLRLKSLNAFFRVEKLLPVWLWAFKWRMP